MLPLRMMAHIRVSPSPPPPPALEQVHRATLFTGEEVVVKVRGPSSQQDEGSEGSASGYSATFHPLPYSPPHTLVTSLANNVHYDSLPQVQHPGLKPPALNLPCPAPPSPPPSLPQVQRPGLKQLFDIDLDNLRILSEQLDKQDENK